MVRSCDIVFWVSLLGVMRHPHSHLALPPRHRQTHWYHTPQLLLCYLHLISPPLRLWLPLSAVTGSQSAGLNVAEAGLVKSTGAHITSANARGPHQTFMQIAMFYLNNYEVIHRKRLLSFFFLGSFPPTEPAVCRGGAEQRQRRRQALPTLETSLAAIFVPVQLCHFLSSVTEKRTASSSIPSAAVCRIYDISATCVHATYEGFNARNSATFRVNHCAVLWCLMKVINSFSLSLPLSFLHRHL